MQDRNQKPGQGERGGRVLEAPPGHSLAAHRVHGWCSHCRGHDAIEETCAWRVWEGERQARREAAMEAQEARPGINAAATPNQRCPGCGDLALTVVTVRVLTDTGPRVAGGWAYCTACDATPHPVMEDGRA